MAQHAKLDIPKVIGTKCYQTFASRKSPCKGCKLQDALKSKTATHFELNQINNDNFYEVSSQPLESTKQVVHIYRNRTEAKKLQEQLVQQEKLASIGLLAGGIAHEINNPLGGILIFSQMLLRELPKDSSHYQDAYEIENAAKRCKEIVSQLLEFARSSNKENQAPVLVQDAIDMGVKFSHMNPEAKKVKINIESIPKNIMVMGEKNKLVQVFLNILQNAIHACREGGEIRVYTKLAKNNLLQIYFDDTGRGIKKSDLSKIFDPFFTTKEPGEGTGLGLSICYRILTEIGGSITAKSTEGKGSSFMVQLPTL